MLDLDATDDLIHGHQAGRFFHGYYKNYCYLPLYIFCGEHLLCARLRPSDIDSAAGSVKELQRIVGQIRQRWPHVEIVIRGDSGFCLLFADRTSADTMRANQQRLWFSSVAYTLLTALRRLGLKNTKMANARCDTIRLKLLKIGARIRVTMRKVWASMTESYPYQSVFRQVCDNLARQCPIRMRR